MTALGNDRMGRILPINLGIRNCCNHSSRRGDLNPRPAHYECAALPLSYVGYNSILVNYFRKLQLFQLFRRSVRFSLRDKIGTFSV